MSSRELLVVLSLLLFLGLDELELEETSTEVGGVSESVMLSCFTANIHRGRGRRRRAFVSLA